MRALAAIVVAMLIALAAPASAQVIGDVDDIRIGAGDAVALGLLVPLDITLYAREPRPRASLGQSPDLDLRLREALAWAPERRHAAGLTSDVLLWSFAVSGMAAPMVDTTEPAPSRTRSLLVGTEAMLGTYAVTAVLKHAVRRARPDVETNPEHEGYASFPSGHTSTAFAGATLLTVYAWQYDWMADDTRWVVPAASYTLAALTGYLRAGARRHWTTDIIAGAVIGTGSALTIWHLRTR